MIKILGKYFGKCFIQRFFVNRVNIFKISLRNITGKIFSTHFFDIFANRGKNMKQIFLFYIFSRGMGWGFYFICFISFQEKGASLGKGIFFLQAYNLCFGQSCFRVHVIKSFDHKVLHF